MLARTAMMMQAGARGLPPPLEFEVVVDCQANPSSFTGDRANLSWTNNPLSPGATTQVWRQREGDGDFSLIATKSAGQESHQDVPGDVAWARYKIRHSRDGVFSAFTDTEEVSIDAGCF